MSCDWSGQQTPGDARAVTRSRGHAEAGSGQTPAHPHQAPGGHVSRLSSHACIILYYYLLDEMKHPKMTGINAAGGDIPVPRPLLLPAVSQDQAQDQGLGGHRVGH